MPARAIVLLALAILATPLATEAQAAEKMFKVGMLVIASREQAAWFINPFEDELRGLGYLPGRNIVFEHRFANGKAELLPRLAAEMVRQKMDVIVTPSNQNTIVAKVATSDIPIVAMFLSQPVAMGLVASLPRPGGNVTGLTQDVDAELSAKRLEILREVAPQARRVAVLVDPAYPGDKPAQQALADAAHKLDVTLEFIDVRSPEELRPCFRGRDAAAHRRTPYHGPSALRHQPVADSRTRGHENRQTVEAGGLMSYGVSLTDISRRAARYVDKILRGAQPADLPVQQPTAYEFVINLKTAKGLGLAIPPSLLLRADQIIQ